MIVHTIWKPLEGEDEGAISRTEYSDLQAALSYGRRLCCLSGVRQVLVIDDEGVLHASYVEGHGHWLTFTEAATADRLGSC